MAILKRLLGALAFVGVLAAPAWATTYYVDGKCPSPGDGTTTSCGTNGPKLTVADGIALMACGDTLRIRGAHPIHGTETGADFDGQYFANSTDVINKTGCGAGTRLTLEAYGWTAPRARTEEKTFINSASSVTWTQCSDCSASGPCAGIPGTCSETWWVDAALPYSQAIAAMKPDKSMTWRAADPSDLTNAHDSTSYNGQACSTDRWLRCYSNSDCDSGQTCTATSPEVDSWRATGTCSTTTTQHCAADSHCPGVETCNTAATDRLFVRWGTGTGAGACDDGYCAPTEFTSYVVNDTIGQGFRVRNSEYVTIRGFIFLGRSDMAVSFSDATGSVDHGEIIDCRSLYASDVGGSDYGFALYGCSDCTLAYSDVAFNGSEVHVEAKNSETDTVVLVHDNWLHHIGDLKVRGPGSTSQTPHCFIMGEQGGANGIGRYAGSQLYNNVCEHVSAMGVIFENYSSGWTAHDNVFRDIGANCLKYDAKGGNANSSTDNHVVYNNLCDTYGLNPGGGTRAGVYWVVTASNTANGNSFYNNTFVNGLGPAFCAKGEVDGEWSNNTFRNNLIDDGDGFQSLNACGATAVDVAVDGTATGNVISNLAIGTSASTAMTWLGTGYTCANVEADCSGVCAGSVCGSASDYSQFIAAGDYHLSTASPAKDAGTPVGLPAGRTADICNSLAYDHGLAWYQDCEPVLDGLYDIGADEYTPPFVPAPLRPRLLDPRLPPGVSGPVLAPPGVSFVPSAAAKKAVN